MPSHIPFLDGVVLVDPDYLKDRKGTVLMLEGREVKWAGIERGPESWSTGTETGKGGSIKLLMKDRY